MLKNSDVAAPRGALFIDWRLPTLGRRASSRRPVDEDATRILASASSTEKGLPTPGRQRRQHIAGVLARSLYFYYFVYLPRAPYRSSSPRTRGDLLAKQIAHLTRSKSHGSYAAIASRFVPLQSNYSDSRFGALS